MDLETWAHEHGKHFMLSLLGALVVPLLLIYTVGLSDTRDPASAVTWTVNFLTDWSAGSEGEYSPADLPM